MCTTLIQDASCVLSAESLQISHFRPKADRPKGARLCGNTTSGEEVSWWVYECGDDIDDYADNNHDDDDDNAL